MADIPIITGEIFRRSGDRRYVICMSWYRNGATMMDGDYRTKKEAEKALSKLRRGIKNLDSDTYFGILHAIKRAVKNL